MLTETQKKGWAYAQALADRQKQIDLAWAAGFFDGEGSVGAYKSGRTFYLSAGYKYPKVSVTNTDLELLEKFQRIVGLGKIYGPRKLEKAHWKPRYDYRLDGFENVQKLFDLLYLYLGTFKIERFEEALASYSNR